MTASLWFGCLWIVLAFVLQSIPSSDNHWRRAYVLIALGIPLLIWIVVQNGAMVGTVFAIAQGSVLRWPIYYSYKWVRHKFD
ncbi:DUF2484 family protein [Yoonia maritima]|uniref:DUF2484 family protein n=1 Tax=Yoonia maritima TaxID=1435347 RepID=UPI000D100155|nr:DUF2484 family protein [Yoonia maritima]